MKKKVQPERAPSATFDALQRSFGGPHRQRKTPMGKVPTSPEKGETTRKRRVVENSDSQKSTSTEGNTQFF